MAAANVMAAANPGWKISPALNPLVELPDAQEDSWWGTLVLEPDLAILAWGQRLPNLRCLFSIGTSPIGRSIVQRAPSRQNAFV
jgi:hypothetical protein